MRHFESFSKGSFPFRGALRERDKENQLGPVIISSVCLAPLLSFFSFSQKTFLALYPSPISPLQQKLPWLEEQREEGERERENNKSELSHLSLLFFFFFSSSTFALLYRHQREKPFPSSTSNSARGRRERKAPTDKKRTREELLKYGFEGMGCGEYWPRIHAERERPQNVTPRESDGRFPCFSIFLLLFLDLSREFMHERTSAKKERRRKEGKHKGFFRSAFRKGL